MKKKPTTRSAKATSRQSTLDFPTSSEADLVEESASAETSTKVGAKNRRKRTADFVDDEDKHNKSHYDSSAVKIDGPSIPNGWCWTTFKDATVNFDGQRVPIKKEDRESRSGEYPYYGASGVIDDIDDYLFDGEFLLVAEDGANLLSRSTPIAFRASGKFWVNNHAHVVQPANGVALRFIEYYLNSIDLKFFVSGSAQPKLNQANLNKIPIPLPSLPEQHRIVAEIEKQFTRLDEGVAALKRVQANLKRYRAAVLKAACEGKLVPTEAEVRKDEGRKINDESKRSTCGGSTSSLIPHTSTFESGDTLLARILTERSQNWQGRGQYKEPALPDRSQLPAIPSGWIWLSVETIGFVTKLAGFEYTKYVKYSADGDLAVIKAENAGRSGFKRTDVSRIKSSTVAQLTRSQLKAGDLLMVFVGAGTGNVARVPDDQPYFLGPNIAMIRVEPQYASGAYLETFLRSPVGHSLTFGFIKAVAQPSLSMGTIRAIPVALPPLAEQMRIVAEVERRLSVVDELEAVVSANLQRAARLRQSILQRAFTGGL
jgi:type I restriction enzyme S subunit